VEQRGEGTQTGARGGKAYWKMRKQRKGGAPKGTEEKNRGKGKERENRCQV